MFNFKDRPYNLLLVTAVLILIASFFAFDQTLDIYLHDTLYVIAMTHIFWTTIILLLIFWTLYSLTKRFLFSKILTWTHIILAIVTSIFLVTISFYSNTYYQGLAGMPRRYFDVDSWEAFKWYNNLTKGILIVIPLMTLGLITYVINFAVGLLKTSAVGHNSR